MGVRVKMRGNAIVGAICGLVMVAASLHPASATDAGIELPDGASDAQTASAQAQSSGEPVEVLAETTPTERLLALPDGTMQLEVSSFPVRVADDSGDWVPVDTDLVRNGDWWEPAASATPVRFSVGGSDVLDEVRTPGGEWITERWPHGTLPAPQIDGPTATYPNVFPGVDLKLTATDIGMASVYVVKSAKAATNDVLDDLHVEIEGAEITKETSGAFTAETADGDSITASSPLWWDSSDGGSYRESGDDSPAMPVEHSHTDSGIRLDVGATIDSEEPTYPIFIDPDWSAGQNAAWYTDVAYPNQSYLNVDTLRVGRYAQYRGNAFFEFGIGALAGKQILSAQLSTTQLQVAASPNSPLQVRTFGIQAAGFTWNQQNHNLWGPVLDTQSPGYWGGPAVTVGWNVTAGVQAKVGNSSIQFGLAPQDENAQSRRHFSKNATLYVNYNTAPNTPTAPKIDSPDRTCGTAGAPAYVSGTSVVVSVDQTDPDAGNVDTNFHLATAPSLSVQQSKAPGLLAQGRRSVTFTGLADGSYAWQARGSDHKLDSAGSSAWCYFTVDNTPPTLPNVTTSATTFTVGQPLDVILSSTADAAGYQYWLAYSGSLTPAQPAPVAISRTTALPDCQKREGGTRFACATGTTPATVSVAPVDALSTLWVAAYDRAGNVSVAKPLPLFVSTGTPAGRDPRVDTGHAWMTTSMIDPLPSVIDDSNQTTPLSLFLPTDSATWQSVTELRPGYTVPVLQPHEPPFAGDAMMTPGQAVNAKESFSVSMWVNPAALDWPTQQFIAEQYGSNHNFSLEVRNGKFAFCVLATAGAGDAANLVSGCATSPTQAVVGDWVLITGIWDAVNQQLRLDVGHLPAPVAVTPHKLSTATGTFPGGEFMIGPPPTSLRFTGLVANPVVVPGVMDSRQLGSLTGFLTPFTY